jgi:hypothetical protein
MTASPIGGAVPVFYASPAPICSIKRCPRLMRILERPVAQDATALQADVDGCAVR